MLLPLVSVVALTLAACLSTGASAATIEVSTKADEFGSGNKCSLREAVRAANDNSDFGGCPKGSGRDTVQLGKGVYRLTRTGAPDDDTTNGDLDFNGPLTLTGRGARKTAIDGNGDVLSERVIEARDTSSGVGTTLARLAIIGGRADSTGEIDGGALTLAGAADVTVRASLIAGNFAGSDGGGINVDDDAAAKLKVVGSTISGNVGDSNAGGINAEDGRVVVRNTVVADNDTPGSNGGGIDLETGGRLLISRSSVSDNEAGSNGGGIYLSGAQLTMEDTTVRGNVAGFTGGGVRLGGGLGTEVQSIARSTIAGNSAGTAAGGIEADGATTTLTDSTVSRNDSGGEGGGIGRVFGSLTVTNSTISGNEADADGGGLAVDDTGAVVALRSTTVARNAADDDEAGGGDGGGLFRADGTLTLANTIVADNFAFGGGVTPDCSGAIMSAGHNLIGIDAAATCVAPPGSGDQIGTSATPLLARLAPLASNGGPTKTHALLPGSPAINAGSPEPLGSSTTACQRRDQRGERRDDCDGGAHER